MGFEGEFFCIKFISGLLFSLRYLWMPFANATMGVSIFNTWFTYLRNSFNHDHIKKKSLKGTFSFYLFGLFKWIHFSLYSYWRFIIWLIIANYCFFYFSRIGHYVLNCSNTSFHVIWTLKLSAVPRALKFIQHGKLLFNLYVKRKQTNIRV